MPGIDNAPKPKINAIKVFVTAMIGAGIAVATFSLSDVALPEDTPWWVHWAMAATSIASYAIGVGAAIALMRNKAEEVIQDTLRQIDESKSRLENERQMHQSDLARLDDEIQRHRSDLDRLAKAEEKNEELRNLLATERTLSSSYLSKYKEASAKLEEREIEAAKEERERRLSEDRRKAAYKEWALSLSPDEKLLLLGIYRDGEKTVGPMSERAFKDGSSTTRYHFMRGIDYTRVSGCNDRYIWRLTLSDMGMTAVSENMDVFLEAERYAEQGTNDANAGAGVR